MVATWQSGEIDVVTARRSPRPRDVQIVLTRAEKHAALSQPDQPTRACALAFLPRQKRHLRPSRSECRLVPRLHSLLRGPPVSHMLTLAGSITLSSNFAYIILQ